MSADIYARIMEFVGQDRFGDGEAMPPEARALRYVVERKSIRRVEQREVAEHQVIASNNDGFELWLGWNSRWDTHLREPEVRALFWWLLWEWFGRARWFGLRRPLYYWALRRHLDRFKKREAA